MQLLSLSIASSVQRFRVKRLLYCASCVSSLARDVSSYPVVVSFGRITHAMPIQTRRQSNLSPQQEPSSPLPTKAHPVTPSPVRSSSVVRKLESPKHAKRPTKKQKSHTYSPPNEDWQALYKLVQELRQDRTAPCDHSGCEALGDRSATPAEFRFHVLISLMLSSQTKDAVVADAVRRMRADGVLNVKSIHTMEPSTLQSYIAKVGFHNNKTKYIKATVEILLEKYGGDIPPTAADMMADLPGVGPKMAYICENAAWNRCSGIGVDTHMHRLFNKLGWVSSETPEQTRVQLESWLPRDYWADVNLLWVGFGQEIQQQRGKIVLKALQCSQPAEALRLLKRCGMKSKSGTMDDEIEKALKESM